jgi:hypothetical protein
VQGPDFKQQYSKKKKKKERKKKMERGHKMLFQIWTGNSWRTEILFYTFINYLLIMPNSNRSLVCRT